MKRFLRLFVVAVIALSCCINVVAAASKCSYEKQASLNDDAANIKVSYEEASGEYEGEYVTGDSGETAPETYSYFKISIYNLTEDFYVKISNDYNDEIKYLSFTDAESRVATYDWYNLDVVTNFTITVYSSNTSGCPGEEYRIIYLTTPRYNFFSNYAQCNGNESFALCQKYTTNTEDVSFETFLKEISNYKNEKVVEEEKKEEEKNQSLGEKVVDFVKENKITVGIVSTIVVIGGVVAIVIVIKRRRSRLI